MNDMDRVKKRRESYAEKNKLSPCIGVCSINPEDNYCYGCKRTQKEIKGNRTDSRYKEENSK